jgi:hypothetical protein
MKIRVRYCVLAGRDSISSSALSRSPSNRPAMSRANLRIQQIHCISQASEARK